jgi:hypothetical protein
MIDKLQGFAEAILEITLGTITVVFIAAALFAMWWGVEQLLTL